MQREDTALETATRVAIERGLYGNPLPPAVKPAKAAKRFYVIVTDGGAVDGICEGKPAANCEKRDLEKMGCAVTICGPFTGGVADDMESDMNAGMSFRKAHAKAKAATVTPQA